ncbi:hypothetical protein MBGDN05_00716 [Thermoplasmatales archaeon SCGC AB-539-N05]|nr:hypothetical protein MBGDN05_00716 [Thermoplasmatales archaeon SCGC AB-539-N05]
MKQITVIVIVAVCIFATFGTTYVAMNAAKNQEILNLREQYEFNISNLRENISSLQSQINDLNKELSKYQEGDYVYGNGTISYSITFISLNGTEVDKYYCLVCENETYEIVKSSLPADYREDDLNVTFVGIIREDMGSFHMVGPFVEILGIERV